MGDSLARTFGGNLGFQMLDLVILPIRSEEGHVACRLAAAVLILKCSKRSSTRKVNS